MEDVDKNEINNRNMSRFRHIAEKVTPQNPINLIANVKQGISHWRQYANTCRKLGGNEERGLDRRNTGGIGLTEELGESKDLTDATIKNTERNYIIAKNRNLIQYFANLAKEEEDACVDLEFVEKLLKDGARIGCTDKYGQTVLHEVARAWHVDVAKFLIERGANVNQGDNFGRTPLHVAAAVDYPEMVEYLITHKANKEVYTLKENQTPVHFAAKNDACQSLKMLIKKGCLYKDVRDYKGRTPLHLAAELDRSETARLLLELDDPAPAGVEDHSGQAAIVWMITKMPPVAKLALDQFHTTDRANRRQYYHLHHLEPRKPDDTREGCPQTALQVTVAYRKFDLIIHPVLNELIKLKWQRFGRFGAWKNTILNFLFIIFWTVQGILVEYDQRHKYILPAQWWRIVLFILAIGLTGWQIKDELFEFFSSKKSHRAWKEWRQSEIEDDIKYSHPRWPEEEQYLRAEIGELDKITPQYFNDFWNIFDWIVYTLLLTCIITHLVDIFAHTDVVARLHIRIMAITVILIWLRLMKNARAFATLGPFIVMLSKMAGDVVRFAFLYLEFYIPYACAFWMLFGGDKVPEDKQGLPDAHNYTMVVNGYGTADALMFSMFRLTLVDEYDYEGMKKVDYVMADILVGTWLALSAILCLNLFIALLSDTFQRVYDNAQANAVMQKAITILSIEDSLNKKRRNNFRKHIHSACNPKVDFYDDDTTELGDEDLKKVTIQIKEDLDELREMWYHGFGSAHHEDLDDLREAFNNSPFLDHDGHRNSGSKDQHLNEKLENEMDLLRDELRSVRDRQEDLMDRFKREMSTIRRLLHDISMNQLGSDHPGGRAGSLPAPAVEAAVSTLTRTAPVPQDRPTYSSRRSRKKEERTKDEEWERSEQQRKKELRRLRQQLAGPHPFFPSAESDGADPPALTMTQTSVPVVEVSEIQQPSITSQATVETDLEPSGVHTTIRVKPHIQETAGDTEC